MKNPAPVKAGAEEASAPGEAKAAGSVPAQMPPPVQLVSPSAPLDVKERHAVILARRWRNRREMPQPGEDGVLRYLFGATLPTVVCAPLQICNLALQPGEVGRATHFETVAEVLAFIQRVLARLRESRESGGESDEA